jgi:hypothetical protein
MVAPQMDQKRLGPLEKPHRITDMYISLICMSVIQKSSKYKRGRIRRRRIAPNRRIRIDKKRRRKKKKKLKRRKEKEENHAICELRSGQGAGDLIFYSLCGPEETKKNKKQRSCDGRRRAAPRLGWQLAQKYGCAQRTGAHARPKPTS